MIERYRKSDAWWDSTYIKEEAFNRLEDLMKYNNALNKGGYYNILVKNDYNE